MADENFMEELEINGVIYTVKDPNGVKRIKLSSQMQRQDYVKSVIALCDTGAGDAWISSYSNGQLIMHRNNGLYGIVSYNIAIEAAWSGDNQINANISGFGKNGYIRPCTFTYNGVIYGGVEISADDASMDTSYFVGETNFNIFALDYYDNKNKVALNEEIANSIKFDTVANSRDNIIKNVPAPVDDGDAVPKDWGFISATYDITSDAELTEVLNTTLSKMSKNSIRYIMANDITGSTVFGGGSWHLKIGKTTDLYAYVEATRYGANTVYKLTNSLWDGAWTGFEWENPPMLAGVEYRTTERYNDKPVYMKRIERAFSEGINATDKTVDVSIPHDISAFEQDVGSLAWIENYRLPVFVGNFSGFTSLHLVSHQGMMIRCHNDTWGTNHVLKVILKYTKVTD